MTPSTPRPHALRATFAGDRRDAAGRDPRDEGEPGRPGLGRRVVRGLLSAVFPGLGQLAARQYRRALLLGGPVVLIVVACLALVVAGNRYAVAASLLDPDVILALLAIQLAILVLRLVSVLLALGPGRIRHRRAPLVTIALVALVVIPQLYLGSVTLAAHAAFTKVFAPAHDSGAWVPAVNETAPPADPSDNPFVVPPGTAAPAHTFVPDSRLTVLLIGVDSGVGRGTMNTDTMIVASLDPAARTVSLLSLPRDTVDVPLPDGRIWSGKINALMSWATLHPQQFPGASNPQSVLEAAIAQLMGIEIDYWAEVDLQGLVNVVNAVGGVDVNVKRGFCDPYYQEYGMMSFGVQPGRYHMNGYQALAYARVRHPLGESDFTRAERQQEVLVALRDRAVGGGFLNDPIGLLDSLGNTVSTDIPPGVIGQYAPFVAGLTRSHVYSVVIEPPLVHSSPGDPRGSIQVPDVEGIRDLAARLFPASGTVPVGFTAMAETGTEETAAANLPRLTCYAPKPTPAPPSPSPSETQSAGPTATPPPTPAPEVTPTPPPEPTAPPPPPPPALTPEPSPAS